MKHFDVDWCCSGACLTTIKEMEDGEFVDRGEAEEKISKLTIERDRYRTALHHIVAGPTDAFAFLIADKALDGDDQ